MLTDNLRIALRNIHRTMTPTQALYIADSLIRTALSEKTKTKDTTARSWKLCGWRMAASPILWN